jgi:hypothetical protein
MFDMGFWSKMFETVGAEYVHIIAGSPSVNGAAMYVKKGSRPNTLRLRTVWNFVEYEVLELEWQENHTRSAASTAVGAIAGGLLAGPVGLLAGAAIGARKKSNSMAILTIIDQGKEQNIYIRCTDIQLRSLKVLIG